VLSNDTKGRFTPLGQGNFRVSTPEEQEVFQFKHRAKARQAQPARAGGAKKAKAPHSRKAPPDSGPSFPLTGWIKSVLPELGDRVTQPATMDLLRERHPEVAARMQSGSVTGALKRLEQQGVLEQVEKGVSNNPSVFRLKGNSTN
jgi:hypothetical protein